MYNRCMANRSEEQKAKHAAYMREYNSRPEAHLKKMLRDREYREKNLEKINDYDRQRNQLQERRAARYVYGKKRREREEVNAYHKQYYQDHKEQYAAKQKRRRDRFTKEEWTEITRRYTFKHKYGITQEGFDDLVKQQEGKCALCSALHGEFGVNGRLHVDHDHASEKVRGLLCIRCNNAIERLDKVEGWAAKAEAYLARPR
jgi:hypothetical protein